MIRKFMLSVLALAFGTFVLQAQTDWTLDKSHSKIRFAVSHMGISETEGQFNEFDAKVTSTTEDFVGARVEFMANTASVDTDNERRDGHLRSDDFFNAEMYPELKFVGIIVNENGETFLVGNMTIRDVTQEERFAVRHLGTINGGNGPKAGFEISGKINRFDYGLKFNRTMPGGDLVVGDNVGIVCKVEINGPAS